jgi:hypothetical protein
MEALLWWTTGEGGATMDPITRVKAAAVLVALMLLPLMMPAAVAAAEPGAGTEVPLHSVLRRCDFSQSSVTPQTPRTGFARGSTRISTTGGAVVAEVSLVNTDQPGSHYDVTLIELPRPSSATCGSGAPGTASSVLDLDASGQATLTLQTAIRPGATGVWVNVTRPNPNSQNPLEYYTSEFVARV